MGHPAVLIPLARRRVLVRLAERGPARTVELVAELGLRGGSASKVLDCGHFAKGPRHRSPWHLTDAGAAAYHAIPPEELPALRSPGPAGESRRIVRDVDADRRHLAAVIRDKGVMWGADLAAAAGLSLSRFWKCVDSRALLGHPWFRLDRGGYRLTERGVREGL